MQKADFRWGLLAVGLVLMAAAGLAFWYILWQLDAREEYLVTTRTLERWEVSSPSDFTAVEANLGDATGVPPEFLELVAGRWATGRIPAGTVVNPGMFQVPPLSSDEDAAKVLIEVSLPSGEAPGGSLTTGDKIALFGAEATGDGVVEPSVGLIGVLDLAFVEGDQITYVVTPAEAKAIQDLVDRYNRAAERRIWKLGFDLSSEALAAVYKPPAPAPVAGDAFDDLAPSLDDSGLQSQ